MKNTSLNIFFSCPLLPVFFSCDKKIPEKKTEARRSDDIVFISVSHVGGHLGNYTIIKVTKDSVKAEKGMTANQTHKEWSAPIQADTWKKLTASIHVKDLDYIKSSPSQQSVDGIDETFQIRTPKKSHIYVNSFADTVHYRQFQQLKEQLNTILPKEYQ